MTCVTPSNPDPIPAGEHYDVYQTIAKTGGLLTDDRDLYKDDMASLMERCRSSLAAVGLDPEEARRAIEELQQVPPAKAPIPVLLQEEPDPRFAKRDNKPWSDQRIDQFARVALLPAPTFADAEVHQMTLRDMYWLMAQDASSANELAQTIALYRAAVFKAFKEKLAAVTAEVEKKRT